MLFNSFEFIFAFLPICLIGYIVILKVFNGRGYAVWLSLASIFFYGWWDIRFLPLLLISMVFNFALGRLLVRPGVSRRGRLILIMGVAANLALLGYFKYVDFFIVNLNSISNVGLDPIGVLLPIGISFFTFQQIAFLVDSYRGNVRRYGFFEYALFISFFPQLIAGPIVHHYEMMPQFSERRSLRFFPENITIGLSIFAMGLFKKVVIADSLAPLSNSIFDAAAGGASLTIYEAWAAALTYTLQLYFDFSGYSEMAIGLARMFGIKLPMNFDSPYKANNIIDFWRRWHMTLSRFLRDYLYFALGGNRKGPSRRYVNLMLTMILGGFWHGAGWTFAIWGLLHGTYLCINHGWRYLCTATPALALLTPRWVGRVVTFMAVMVAWVYFRAADIHAAHEVLGAMFGANGVVLPVGLYDRLGNVAAMLGMGIGGMWENTSPSIDRNGILVSAVLLLAFCWIAPGVNEIFGRFDPVIDRDMAERAPRRLSWRPTALWATVISLMLAVALIMMYTARTTEFLYFQF